MTEHSSIPFPIEDEQSVIWRYMDFTKFVSLLDKSSLFFCRADKLDDPFEGSSTLPDSETWKHYLQELLNGKIDNEKVSQILQEDSDGRKHFKRLVAINSWYMQEEESAAMWQLYTKSNEAIAIRSTFGRLRDSLPNYSQLLIGSVKYINYSKDSVPKNFVTDSYFYKRKSFEYEKEVRAILLNLNPNWLPEIQAVNVDGGIYIKVKISTLIDQVYVAPKSPNWFKELVENVLKLYKIQKDVIRTSLDDKELY